MEQGIAWLLLSPNVGEGMWSPPLLSLLHLGCDDEGANLAVCLLPWFEFFLNTVSRGDPKGQQLQLSGLKIRFRHCSRSPLHILHLCSGVTPIINVPLSSYY